MLQVFYSEYCFNQSRRHQVTDKSGVYIPNGFIYSVCGLIKQLNGIIYASKQSVVIKYSRYSIPCPKRKSRTLRCFDTAFVYNCITVMAGYQVNLKITCPDYRRVKADADRTGKSCCTYAFCPGNGNVCTA